MSVENKEPEEIRESKGYVGNFGMNVYLSVFCMNCGKTFSIMTPEKSVICPHCGKEVEAIV